MSSTEISKGFKMTNPGLIDTRKGPYPTTAIACQKIPNTTKLIDGLQVNYRDGIVVLIGENGNYTEYWWNGGFADTNLVEATLSLSKNGDYFSLKGIYLDASGKTVANAALEATPPIRLNKTKDLLIRGRGTATLPYLIYLDKSQKTIGALLGSIGNGIIRINKSTYPANAVYFRAVALLNNGFLDNPDLQSVHNAIEDLRSDAGVFTPTKSGYYLDKTGKKILDNGGSKQSDFIPISQVNEYVLVNVFSSEREAAGFFYDKNYAPISEVVADPGNSNVILNSSNIPASAVHLVTNTFGSQPSYIIQKPNAASDSLIKKDNYEKSLMFNPFTKLGYVTATGAFTVDGSIRSTDFLPVDKAILINLTSNGFGVQPLIFFDSAKTLIATTNYPAGTYTFNLDDVKPPNAKYYKANGNSANTPYILTNWGDFIIQALNRIITVDTTAFVIKEPGKGLSTFDFDFARKNKVDNLITSGTGRKVLTDAGTYVEMSSGGEVINVVTPTKEVVADQFSIARKKEQKPIVCFTFDDAYTTDYTQVKPILENAGIMATWMVNRFDEPGLLTSAQILEMHKSGHEFGSHTLNHTILGVGSLNKVINLGDEYIITNNGYYSDNPFTNNLFAIPKGQSIDVWVGNKTTKVKYTVNESTLAAGNTVKLKLIGPATVAVTTIQEIWLDNNSVEKVILPPKQNLNSLGIPVNGIAYPYGALHTDNKSTINKHFSYGRAALTGTSGIVFSGVKNDINYKFDQFKVPATEIVNLSEADMRTLLNEVTTKKGVLIILGHSNSPTLLDKLNSFISISTSEYSVSFKTISEALAERGNLLNLGNYSVSAQGIPNIGCNILPELSITTATSLQDLPTGFSMMRVQTADAATVGVPEAGVLMNYITVFPDNDNSTEIRASWSFQTFQGYATQRMLIRRLTGNLTASRWKAIGGGDAGTAFPITALQVGDQFFRTDLNKNYWYGAGNKWVDAMGTQAT